MIVYSSERGDENKQRRVGRYKTTQWRGRAVGGPEIQYNQLVRINFRVSLNFGVTKAFYPGITKRKISDSDWIIV